MYNSYIKDVIIYDNNNLRNVQTRGDGNKIIE